MTKNCMKPCGHCSFRRDTPPGNLGGSPPETFMAQMPGPFRIPCHLAYNPAGYPTRQELLEATLAMPQCGGAAVMRANMGLNEHLPDHIHKLAPDHVTVFSSPVEFYAHHKQITQVQAAMQLIARPIPVLMAELLARGNGLIKRV